MRRADSGNPGSLGRRAVAALGLRPPVIPVPPQGFALHDVSVVNPGLDREAGRRVVVEGATIRDISEAGDAPAEGVAGSRYAGCYALPGLIDMHVHYPLLPSRWIPSTFDAAEGAALLYLAYGVTTVRDAGNFDGIWSRKQKMAEPDSPSPRMFCCGPILDGEESRMGLLARKVRNPAEAQAAVDDLANRGANFIKVYDWLTPRSLAAVREAAARRRLPVVGHIPFSVSFEEARVHDVQHLNGLQFEEMPPGFDFHDREDFARYYRCWASIPEERIEQIVRISVEQGIVHTPTIAVQDRIARSRDAAADETSRLLPRYFRDVLWNPEVGIPCLQGHSDDVLRDMKEAVVQIRRVVGRLHRAGVRILAGTDGPGNPGTTPGVSLHEELQQLVSSGLTPEEAWTAATRHAGEFLGLPLLGTLQKNAPADILLFREDPTRDLSALSTLEAVAAGGRLYPKGVLDVGVARHARYFARPLFDFVTMAVARRAMRMFG